MRPARRDATPVDHRKAAICERNVGGYIARRPARARPSVTSSAYSRSPPDGKPAREPRDLHATAQAVGQVCSRRLARHRRVRREDDLGDAVGLDAPDEPVDAQVARLDSVERRQRPSEHVVEAAVLAGALDRHDVDRLLDDADDRCDPAGRPSRPRRAPPRSGSRTRGRSEPAPSPPRSPVRARAPPRGASRARGTRVAARSAARSRGAS